MLLSRLYKLVFCLFAVATSTLSLAEGSDRLRGTVFGGLWEFSQGVYNERAHTIELYAIASDDPCHRSRQASAFIQIDLGTGTSLTAAQYAFEESADQQADFVAYSEGSPVRYPVQGQMSVQTVDTSTFTATLDVQSNDAWVGAVQGEFVGTICR